MPEDGEQRRPRTGMWQFVRLVVSIALAGIALYVVFGRRGELSSAGDILKTMDWYWVALAVVLELGSLVAFAGIQRVLLDSGGVSVSMPALFGITLAGNSITNSLPAGPAWASYFAFRQFRRFGADATLSGWVLVGVILTSSLSLGILATGGLVISVTRDNGSFGIASTVVTCLIGALVLAGGAYALLRRARRHVAAAVWAVRLSQRLTKRPTGNPQRIVESVFERLAEVAPRRSNVAAALGCAVANWGLDLGCLVCAFLALHVRVPWDGILLAYGAGQLAANLPLTPGGLGVVEGSLDIALAAYVGSQAETVAAIFLYRIMSFWMLLPMGWISWIGIHIAERGATAAIVDVPLPEVAT